MVKAAFPIAEFSNSEGQRIAMHCLIFIVFRGKCSVKCSQATSECEFICPGQTASGVSEAEEEEEVVVAVAEEWRGEGGD